MIYDSSLESIWGYKTSKAHGLFSKFTIYCSLITVLLDFCHHKLFEISNY